MPRLESDSAINVGTPVRFLRGVGEARAELLGNAGLRTVGDVLYFFPFRYEDRRHPTRIIDLGRIDQPVTLRGRVVSARARTSPVKRVGIFEAILDDGTGSVPLIWFNQPYLGEQIHKNDRLSVYGQARISGRGHLQIENPDFEKIDESGAEDEGSIVPVYSSVKTIPPKAVRRMVTQSLEALITVDEPLDESLRNRLGVIGLRKAILALHSPDEIDEDLLQQRSPAHHRMIMQEFFAFQLALRVRRATEETKAKSRAIVIDEKTRAAVRAVLPFRLTSAQKRVLKEIADDLRSPKPMYRLLQGDVGSGKTIVALIAAVVAIRNGYQAALLAPTEILVEQHFQRIVQLVDGSIRIAKLTGSTRTSERRQILSALEKGEVDLIVGTHALLEESVKLRSFGLAIVDEQHRFGVAQRQKLFAKGELPDVLVMTATPIPRSLALSLYGDLELSVIDELPPGRTAVKTVVRGTGRLPKIVSFVEQQLAAGAQAYFVYPLIEESETLDLKTLTAGFEETRQHFPSRRVAMLHGRMTSEEKEATMARFKAGEIDILVATTVIEVGIDVPNASVMLVFDAGRFGLSQLHQLRGRVGRGSRQSYCVLLRDERSAEETKERLRLFEATRDGFKVAEEDLRLRGAGDFFGTRQSGLPRFRFGDIIRDYRLMELARRVAIETVADRGLSEAKAIATRLLPRALETIKERD